MARRSRAWESAHEERADISQANDKTLQDAAKIFTHTSVTDLTEGRGKNANRELARELAEYKGLELTEKNIKNQMRSIERWQKRERGEGGQTAKPSKPMQAILNRIGTQRKTSGKKTQVKVHGPSSVNGYKRKERDAEMYLDPDESRELFNAIFAGDMDAAWDTLAHAYGVNEFHAYDDASIDIID